MKKRNITGNTLKLSLVTLAILTSFSLGGCSEDNTKTTQQLKEFGDKKPNTQVKVEQSKTTKEANDTLVNTYKRGWHSNPTIATLNNGDFIVSWTSNIQDNNSYGIYIQRYNSIGEKIGKDSLINPQIDENQYDSSIAPLEDGGFIISWSVNGSIFMQRYDKNSTKTSDVELVNSSTNNWQHGSSIIGLKDGGFVILWTADGDTTTNGIFTQIYDESGNKIGNEQLVSTSEDEKQNKSSITALDNGGYIISWSQHGNLSLQRYDKTGNKSGVETLVDDSKNTYQYNSKITALKDGKYIVCRHVLEKKNMKEYDKNDNIILDKVEVGDYTSESKSTPSISSLQDGGFIISWTSWGEDGNGYGVFMQQYDENSTKVGEKIVVNNYKDGNQYDSSVTALKNGGFAICWASDGQSENSNGIYMKVFNK